jgi:TetR/AcrR family tetracycline transcriptional repressor
MSSRRHEVLHAALALLDEVGLDGITVRKLAQRLGVQPGALYRHFDSKRALLDAMVEYIASGSGKAMLELDEDADWTAQVRAVAVATRAGMLAHRDGARLMATFAEPGPSAVEGWQRFTAILRRSGTTEQGAAIAADTIFCYVNGFTIEEQARSATPDPGRDHMFLAGLGIVIAGIRATVPEHSSTLPC